MDQKIEKDDCSNHNNTGTLFTRFIWALASKGQGVYPY